MPFVFLIVGLIVLIASVRGKHGEMISLLKSEFAGSNSFIQWALAIIILASLGYIKPIRPIADAFVGLIILVMILSNKGLFDQFQKQIHGAVPNDAPSSSTVPPPPPPSPLIKSILPVHPMDPLLIPG